MLPESTLDGRSPARYGRPVGRPLLLVSGLAAIGALAGCVFLLPSEPLGATCRFSGETSTACGQCIARECRAKVDGCCGDTSCSYSTLDDLDRCGEGKPCGSFASARETSSRGAREELGACVATACAAECDLSTSTSSSSSGGTSALKVDCEKHPSLPLCSCTAATGDASAGAGTCNYRDVSDSTLHVTCCATSGWPKVSGGTCECGAFVCSKSRTRPGCDCAWGAEGASYEPSSGCSKGSPSYQWECCQNGRSCYCFEDTSIPRCPSGATSVRSCTPDEIACPSGTQHVSTCKD